MVNKHAPLRKKLLRANHAPCIKKTLRKGLCVGFNLKQNISKLKLKPTSNYTKSITTFAVRYTKGKEENIMSL